MSLEKPVTGLDILAQHLRQLLTSRACEARKRADGETWCPEARVGPVRCRKSSASPSFSPPWPHHRRIPLGGLGPAFCPPGWSYPVFCSRSIPLLVILKASGSPETLAFSRSVS